jgi:hypothetical protein
MPSTRTTDPQTSHDAAQSVRNITATKLAILEVLFRSLTDEDLIDRYYARVEVGLAPLASPSGIRSRRAELVRDGYVEAVDFAKTASGRTTLMWRVTLDGRAAVDAKATGL